MLKVNSRIIPSVLLAILGGWYPIPAPASQEAEAGPVPKRVFATRYPLLAHLAGTEGTVRLVAVVSSQGTVRDVRVISGPGLLIDPAKQMVSKWLFSGCAAQSRACEAPVTFRFVLEPDLCEAADCPNDVQFDAPSTVTIRSGRRRAIVN
jgi:hypothetical protein